LVGIVTVHRLIRNKNMKKKAQVGPIGAIFLFIVFIVIWFVWLGGWINQLMYSVVAANNFTGIEAFFLLNFNLVIATCLILSMLAWGYFS